MLGFKLEATKRAINFGDKKNSKFFTLFYAKFISFRRCNHEKGNEGLIRKQFPSFTCQFWSHFSEKIGPVLYPGTGTVQTNKTKR
jgi:hypothetical protein